MGSPVGCLMRVRKMTYLGQPATTLVTMSSVVVLCTSTNNFPFPIMTFFALPSINQIERCWHQPLLTSKWKCPIGAVWAELSFVRVAYRWSAKCYIIPPQGEQCVLDIFSHQIHIHLFTHASALRIMGLWGENLMEGWRDTDLESTHLSIQGKELLKECLTVMRQPVCTYCGCSRLGCRDIYPSVLRVSDEPTVLDVAILASGKNKLPKRALNAWWVV